MKKTSASLTQFIVYMAIIGGAIYFAWPLIQRVLGFIFAMFMVSLFYLLMAAIPILVLIGIWQVVKWAAR